VNAKRTLQRWSTVLLTVAMGVGAPVSALARGAPAPGGNRADCAALQQVAGGHPGWVKAYPGLRADLGQCSPPSTAPNSQDSKGSRGAPDPQPAQQTLAAATTSTSFSDLQGFDWASADITLLAQLGVVQGVGGGQFAPAQQITRAEFAALLQRLFLLPQPANPEGFVDVQAGAWDYSAIEAAAPYMTQFDTPGGVAFEPSLPEVRIEVAATIGEIEVAEGLATLPAAAQAAQIWGQFSDANLVPAGLEQTAAVALQAGLMQGYPGGSFGVEDTLTRAEAAVLLARVLRGDETIGTEGTPPPVLQGSGPAVTEVAPNTGPTGGGTAVTITGAGFAPGAQVLFAGTAATSVTYVSASRLDAVSPAGTGTVNVVVAESAGTSPAVSSDLFTYTTTQGGPVVTSLAPASGPAAGGTQVTLSGSGFLPGAEVLFGATASGSVTYVNGSTLRALSPAGTGTVGVLVAESTGTSPSVSADLFTYTSAESGLSVTGISPDSGAAGGGTPVVVSGTGFAQGAQVYFGGTAATSLTVYNATTITATSPAGAGTVAITVVQGGTTVGSPSAQYTYTCNGTVSGQTYCTG